MSEPTVVALDIRNGRLYSATYSHEGSAKLEMPHYAEPLRKALNARHKEQKAAKKATAYWKIVDKGPSAWPRWQIVSSRTGAEIAVFGVKDNAKNYAKKLNKAAFEEGASQ